MMNVRGDDNSNATLKTTTTLVTNDELKKSLATIRARKAAPSWLDQLPSMMRGHETKLTQVHKTTHNFRARNQNKKNRTNENIQFQQSIKQVSFLSFAKNSIQKNTHKNDSF